MQSVATSSYLADFRRDNGEATSNAQACENNQAHYQFKSVTSSETVGEPVFAAGPPPTLTLEVRITTTANLLGEDPEVSTSHQVISYLRGSDGYWRINSVEWAD
ncbi:MAG: hypothetical protein QM658_16135, partial [Gordonia sp. (in: high G+C Gram-positive bacteria)]